MPAQQIKIKDNVLTKEVHEKIVHTVVSGSLPLQMSPVVKNSPTAEPEQLTNNLQFSHMFYKNYGPQSNFGSLISPLLDILKPLAIVRIKLNITPPTEKIYQYLLHYDMTDKLSWKEEFVKPYDQCLNAIYYLNTNDGYTIFEDGYKVPSVENRLAIFSNTLKHAGTTCTNTYWRGVINFCFIPSADS
jgi:hypothetical protein